MERKGEQMNGALRPEGSSAFQVNLLDEGMSKEYDWTNWSVMASDRMGQLPKAQISYKNEPIAEIETIEGEDYFERHQINGIDYIVHNEVHSPDERFTVYDTKGRIVYRSKWLNFEGQFWGSDPKDPKKPKLIKTEPDRHEFESDGIYINGQKVEMKKFDN